MNLLPALAASILVSLSAPAQSTNPPVRIALIGLEHDHALGFIPGLKGRGDVCLVGIVESNPELIARYAGRFELNTNLFVPSLDALLARTNVQAAAVFSSAFDHRKIVEACAAKKIDVMMEKPLAVNMEHARAIAAAAKASGIQVIVNYETTWYPSTHAAYDLVCDRHEIGDVRRIVVHDGHKGPKEIGCSTNFLNWLTDPVLNGGGALIDFGCYGANLATWLMGGQRPLAVTAVTQQIKPDVYPKVDDEATIVVVYPKAQAVIQASWNWAIDRKDMEIYGQTGYVLAPNRDLLNIRKAGSKETSVRPDALSAPDTDPVSYLVAVERREIKPSGLSSLELNLVVTEILDAARESARTGRRIDFSK
ncbi:MAG: Gfo/Idh/MocA family oxidoreductase [Verrucomicrobiota bacterium]